MCTHTQETEEKGAFMLVSAAPMLRAAEKGHYAIAAFNTNNLEWTRSILTAAEEAQSPVIIQCTSGAAK